MSTKLLKQILYNVNKRKRRNETCIKKSEVIHSMALGAICNMMAIMHNNLYCTAKSPDCAPRSQDYNFQIPKSQHCEKVSGFQAL